MKKINVSTQKKHSISPYLYMQFMEPLSNADTSVDAAWDYLHDCWQPCVVDAIKELAPPMIRFGGCFASYYLAKLLPLGGIWGLIVAGFIAVGIYIVVIFIFYGRSSEFKRFLARFVKKGKCV